MYSYHSEPSFSLGTFLAIYLLIYAVIGVIFGNLTRRLAAHKGYYGYFWTGFFLNVIGLIYVVGLPLSPQEWERRMRPPTPRTLDTSPVFSARTDSAQQQPSANTASCPKCGAKNTTGNRKCWACDADL